MYDKICSFIGVIFGVLLIFCSLVAFVYLGLTLAKSIPADFIGFSDMFNDIFSLF